MPERSEIHITSACEPHDHSYCIEAALTRARSVCQVNHTRLTELREKVLLLVWQSHKPLGAYEIMAQFSNDQSKPVAPPTIYRALGFLQQQGLVHRIASLNAYTGCARPGHNHVCQFLLCRECGVAVETRSSGISHAVHNNADKYGFTIDHETIEISGLCPLCQP